AEVGHVFAPAKHLGGALLDRPELVGEVPFAHQPLAVLHRDLIGERRDLLQIFVRDVREQLERPQAVGVHSLSWLGFTRRNLTATPRVAGFAVRRPARTTRGSATLTRVTAAAIVLAMLAGAGGWGIPGQ